MDFASSTFQKAAGAIRLSRRHKCRDSLIISICNHDRARTCEEIVECESHLSGSFKRSAIRLISLGTRWPGIARQNRPQAEQSQTSRLNPNSVRSSAISPSVRLRHQQYMHTAIICVAPFSGIHLSDEKRRTLPSHVVVLFPLPLFFDHGVVKIAPDSFVDRFV